MLQSSSFFFFFNDTATTEIYTLSLHDALPISWCSPPISARSRCCCRATSRARAARCTSATSARAHTALPFLIFDADPYMVIDGGGRLRWILDAYTATTRYPYAQPLSNGVNYMRNSVKVVIDAYDGSVTAYQADAVDPLVRTFAKIFPGIFHPLDSMPADLRAHLRYPEDLFHIQTELYGTYHMAEPDIFYHREDQWQKPVLSIAPERPDPFLRHMVMRLPEEKQAEFILMVPFTPRGKDNLASWMVARNDGAHYGEMVVYRFPKQSLVLGPRRSSTASIRTRRSRARSRCGIRVARR